MQGGRRRELCQHHQAKPRNRIVVSLTRAEGDEEAGAGFALDLLMTSASNLLTMGWLSRHGCCWCALGVHLMLLRMLIVAIIPTADAPYHRAKPICCGHR